MPPKKPLPTQAFMIDAAHARLAALYHPPQCERPGRPIGCLILVGGPQYRAGAHRQYIDLARYLSDKGIGVLRFDYAGMGDSEGTLKDLADRGEDIAAASHALSERLGDGARIFPWGLCEGASAIFMHHTKIVNLAGAIIANPWVGDAHIEAQVHWRHHYLGRLSAKSIWQRMRKGQFSGKRLIETAQGFAKGVYPNVHANEDQSLLSMPNDLMQLIARNKPILYLASADDRERETFDFAMKKDERWRKLRKSSLFIRKDLQHTDHTFSSTKAKKRVRHLTWDFIEKQTKPVSLQAPKAA